MRAARKVMRIIEEKLPLEEKLRRLSMNSMVLQVKTHGKTIVNQRP